MQIFNFHPPDEPCEIYNEGRTLLLAEDLLIKKYKDKLLGQKCNVLPSAVAMSVDNRFYGKPVTITRLFANIPIRVTITNSTGRTNFTYLCCLDFINLMSKPIIREYEFGALFDVDS